MLLRKELLRVKEKMGNNVWKLKDELRERERRQVVGASTETTTDGV